VKKKKKPKPKPKVKKVVYVTDSSRDDDVEYIKKHKPKREPEPKPQSSQEYLNVFGRFSGSNLLTSERPASPMPRRVTPRETDDSARRDGGGHPVAREPRTGRHLHQPPPFATVTRVLVLDRLWERTYNTVCVERDENDLTDDG
jgi:hypothetical protein